MNKTKKFLTLKANAKENLLGQYNIAIPSLLMISIYSLLVNNLSTSINNNDGTALSYFLYLFFTAISLLLLKVFSIGRATLFLNLMTKRDSKLNDIYQGFKFDHKRSIQLCAIYVLLVGILGYLPLLVFNNMIFKKSVHSNVNNSVLFLISILLIFCIILSLYIALSFAQIFFLANDFPTLSARDIIKYSCKIMKGNRILLFQLHISFIPWYLLSILTCGLALLWILPYLYSTLTLFYLDLINQQ